MSYILSKILKLNFLKLFNIIFNKNGLIIRFHFYLILGEKVTTTKITTSKTKKNIENFVNHHYIENGFLVDHNIENHCLFSSSLLRKSEHQKECEKNIESHSFV